MYQEGKFTETFNESRDLHRLKSFVQKFIPASTTSAPVPAHTKPAVPINPTGEVLVLNEDTFLNVIKKERVFVKFYAPWCVTLFIKVI
jgi:thiol:disulfide interchange protein